MHDVKGRKKWRKPWENSDCEWICTCHPVHTKSWAWIHKIALQGPISRKGLGLACYHFVLDLSPKTSLDIFRLKSVCEIGPRGLSLNLTLLYLIFKPKPWLSPFVNIGPNHSVKNWSFKLRHWIVFAHFYVLIAFLMKFLVLNIMMRDQWIIFRNFFNICTKTFVAQF